MFCAGCKVSLIRINIKSEWKLYHQSIDKVLDIACLKKEGPHAEENISL